MPFCAQSPYASTSWSPPCFMKFDGLEWGAIFGMEKMWMLIGLMSERVLKDLMTHGKVTLASADYSTVNLKRGDEHPEVLFNADFSCAATTHTGAMLDVGVSGLLLRIDADKNKKVYEQAPSSKSDAESILG